MRTSSLIDVVKGTLAIAALAIAPILTASTSFAQEMPTYGPDAADSAPARPSSVQIAPVAPAPVALPREVAGDPFDFAPVAQMPLEALSSTPCEASASCPVMYRLGVGWAIDTGGPGIHIERNGADDE